MSITTPNKMTYFTIRFEPFGLKTIRNCRRAAPLIVFPFKLAEGWTRSQLLCQQKSQVRRLWATQCGSYAEDLGNFIYLGRELVWLHAPLSSFHGTERALPPRLYPDFHLSHAWLCSEHRQEEEEVFQVRCQNGCLNHSRISGTQGCAQQPLQTSWRRWRTASVDELAWCSALLARLSHKPRQPISKEV